jgi:SAM-dependent methyltransferase
MSKAGESFQPISVKSPAAAPFLYRLRCLLDLQLHTIATFLRPAMADLPPGSIVDVGAGESPWRDWLPGGCSYHGIDIHHATEFGMSRRGGEVILYDGGVMPFAANSFEGALCIEVLEHARDPDFLLTETFRILKPGALLLLTVPWSARRHHIPYDFHRFTRERLQDLLTDAGFTDCRVAERGNDYCVIANKLVVVLIRNATRLRLRNALYRLPLMAITSVFAATMLLIAHLSLRFATPGNEDPLGYACRAVKPG